MTSSYANLVVSIVPIDGLAPLAANAFADKVVAKFGTLYHYSDLTMPLFFQRIAV